MVFPFIFTIPIVSFFVFFALSTEAILSDEKIADWDRNGFLVKVLSRRGPNSEVKSCTGAQITASLVLTSAECVTDKQRTGPKNKRKHFQEFAVLGLNPEGVVNSTGADAEFRSKAKLLKVSSSAYPQGGWAMLLVAERNTSELCPKSPASKWLSRLNFNSTLANVSSRFDVDEAQLRDNTLAECYVLGFLTPKNAEEFNEERRVFRLFLDRIDQPSADDPFRHHHSKVHNENFTTCFGDEGAPLICKIRALDDLELQVGIYQTLKAPKPTKEEEERNGEEKDEEGGGEVDDGGDDGGLGRCRKGGQMLFTLFTNDTELAGAIQRYGRSEFADAYKECGFVADG